MAALFLVEDSILYVEALQKCSVKWPFALSLLIFQRLSSVITCVFKANSSQVRSSQHLCLYGAGWFYWLSALNAGRLSAGVSVGFFSAFIFSKRKAEAGIYHVPLLFNVHHLQGRRNVLTALTSIKQLNTGQLQLIYFISRMTDDKLFTHNQFRCQMETHCFSEWESPVAQCLFCLRWYVCRQPATAWV